jgi:leucyl aminopeptidase (aminopeptidase T)
MEHGRASKRSHDHAPGVGATPDSGPCHAPRTAAKQRAHMIRAVPDLGPSVQTIVHRCLAVEAGEDVVVIVDRGTRAIGEALRAGAANTGADAVLAVMDPREGDGNEPPPPIAAALGACDVFMAPTTRSLSHTTARKRATDGGARGATMPGVTEEMLARVMAVDFDLMAARSRAVAALFDAADTAHFTCPRGSDLRLDLSGRHGISDDGDLTTRGVFGNLPCGEGFIAPVSGEGRVVASSVGPLGISDEPAILTVSDGRLIAAEGGLGHEWLKLLDAHGERGRNLAELGVGTNDRAQLTGLVLEDEKILGTVHVAFGASAGIGGTVSVPIHLDVVVLEPTLELEGQPVLENGKFVLETA